MNTGFLWRGREVHAGTLCAATLSAGTAPAATQVWTRRGARIGTLLTRDDRALSSSDRVGCGLGAALAMSVGMGIASSVCAQEAAIDIIALSGAPGTALGLGPNLGTGVHFINFGVHPPVLNDGGEVAFSANVTGANSEGIWSSVGGTLGVVARIGNDGPGPGVGAGITFNSGFGVPILNAAGEVAFRGRLTGTGIDFITNHEGIWSNAGGTLTVVARAGTDGPGPNVGAGINFAAGFNPGSAAPYALNNVGTSAFRARITGPGIVVGANDSGIWSNATGAPSAVARTGSAGPGPNLGAGINFDAINDPKLNGAGQTAFTGVLTGPGISSSNNRGIWSNVGGPLAVVARTGSDGPGPGLGAGINFSDVGGVNESLVFNAVGVLGFIGGLTGGGVTGFNNQGIWSTAGGTLAVVARAGAEGPGPGLGAGVDFLGFNLGSRPAINSIGEVAFSAGLTGTGVNASSNRGIWSNAGGTLAVVARSGSDGPGPGLDEGIVFSSTSFTSGLSMNAVGNVAFTAIVTGTGVTTFNDSGLWASRDGVLHNIVREGDLFDVDPGLGMDLRTISGIELVNIGGSGGLDGIAMAFNDSGDLVFRLFFTDASSGIAKWRGCAAEPEPCKGGGDLLFADGFE